MCHKRPQQREQQQCCLICRLHPSDAMMSLQGPHSVVLRLVSYVTAAALYYRVVNVFYAGCLMSCASTTCQMARVGSTPPTWTATDTATTTSTCSQVWMGHLMLRSLVSTCHKTAAYQWCGMTHVTWTASKNG
jgi:carbohydrate-binding DOMON domain-containing protein